MKPFDIFSAGKHVASDGRVITFTAAQMRDAAAKYDPKLHEAPIVIGHPETSAAPAYGWIERIAFEPKAGDVVIATPKQVQAEFEEGVKSGLWKKVSSAWYLPEDPENPTPGTPYLHHVAFLGAKAPAVKGLREIQFNAASKGIVQFADWRQMAIVRVLRGLKNFLIEKHGQETADKVVPEYELENAAAEPPALASYAEHQREITDVLTKEELERREKELKDQKDAHDRSVVAFAEREKAFNTTQTAAARTARLASCATFIDDQVKAGKVLPAQRDGLVAFMASLPEAGVVEFGEGEKAVKKPTIDWLRAYIEAQPKVVEFGEHGHRGVSQIDTSNPVKAATEIARKAAEFQESEKKLGRVISIDAAVQHVTKGENA